MGANVQAGYALGMLVGSFLFGAISDIFGRRFCMLLCSVLAVCLVKMKKLSYRFKILKFLPLFDT